MGLQPVHRLGTLIRRGPCPGHRAAVGGARWPPICNLHPRTGAEGVTPATHCAIGPFRTLHSIHTEPSCMPPRGHSEVAAAHEPLTALPHHAGDKNAKVTPRKCTVTTGWNPQRRTQHKYTLPLHNRTWQKHIPSLEPKIVVRRRRMKPAFVFRQGNGCPGDKGPRSLTAPQQPPRTGSQFFWPLVHSCVLRPHGTL